MKIINVLHLIQGLEFGGLEKVTLSLIDGLDKNRYSGSICCFDSLGNLVNRVNGNTKVHFLGRKQGIDYLYPFKLARLLKEHQIQVLHLHNSTAFFYGVIAGKIARVPVIVYTEHARDVFPNLKVRIADKLLSFFTNRIVVVAGYLKNNLIKYEKFKEKKISVIHNGIDADCYNVKTDCREIRTKLGIDETTNVVGIVARLDPIKNHKCLIKAMKQVISEKPKTVLLIIGDGPIRSGLEMLVSDLMLGRNIKFLGMRADIPELMAAMDVFVLCSRSEGLSITLLEAMAAGKPVVATNVGGNPELIEHGVNGLLVQPDDRDGLSKAIIACLNDKSKAETMGRAAQKKVSERFTADNMIKKYEEIYGDCLKCAE
jgi:sugar transferase (PEP-CTERM/EpsH1 system associated)